MAKPQNTTELDNAKRILQMLEIVRDPEHYKKVFEITDNDVDKCREIVQSVSKFKLPSFIEK
jgi:hypothetical protein